MQKFTHFFRRLHNVLGLIVGAQVVIWVASGLFFTLRPIDEVRGRHLRSEAHAMISALPEGAAPVGAVLAAAGEPVMRLSVKPWLGRAVWEAEMHSGTALFDYETGAPLSPVSEADARRLAEDAWAGDGVLVRLALIEDAPAEVGEAAGRAIWRADFEGKDNATFWIDPQAGEITAVRTSWWRAFDLFWGLHIMDWTNRETISSWWMKLFAFGALMLSLAGAWLVIDRTLKGRLLK
jgi:uncharacterized iron-regulated membrane protein